MTGWFTSRSGESGRHTPTGIGLSGSSTPLLVTTKLSWKYSAIERWVFLARPTTWARLFMKLIRHSQNGTASPMWPMQILSLGNRSNTPPAIIRTA